MDEALKLLDLVHRHLTGRAKDLQEVCEVIELFQKNETTPPDVREDRPDVGPHNSGKEIWTLGCQYYDKIGNNYGRSSKKNECPSFELYHRETKTQGKSYPLFLQTRRTPTKIIITISKSFTYITAGNT